MEVYWKGKDKETEREQEIQKKQKLKIGKRTYSRRDHSAKVADFMKIKIKPKILEEILYYRRKASNNIMKENKNTLILTIK